MQSSFTSGVRSVGTTNGTVLPVITQVALNDTSHFTFDYTNSLQVSVIRNYFGALERNATTSLMKHRQATCRGCWIAVFPRATGRA